MAAAEAVGRDTLPEHWSYGVCRDGRVFFIDDLTRATTWLHPRTGEPVNSGHMIRSGHLFVHWKMLLFKGLPIAEEYFAQLIATSVNVQAVELVYAVTFKNSPLA
ncbi:Pleckstrin-likey domain-containing family A member 7 [Varanus komodoensis]|nr:Pleckstrin-likey domain-containing family A member 7 [Varanus komodoensis]